MELSEIPSAFQSKVRLALVAALAAGEQTFRSLKTVTGATDGNLGRQLEILQTQGIVRAEKRGGGSVYSLTGEGRRLLTAYVELLRRMLETAEEQSAGETA